MLCYCEECEGITYHANGTVERKSDKVRLTTIECEECETRTIINE